MKWNIFVLAVLLINFGDFIEARKTSGRSRGSSSKGGSYTSRKTQPTHTVPSSYSYSGSNSNYAPSAPKLENRFSGWQSSNSQPHNYGGGQSSLSNIGWKPASGQQSISYPSSKTGLSGSGTAHQPPSYQQTVKQTHTYPQNNPAHQSVQQSQSYPQNKQQPQQTYPQNNQQHSNAQGSQKGHNYPSSTGLSGTGSANKPVGQQGHVYPTSGGLSGGGSANYPNQYPNNNQYHQNSNPHQSPINNYGGVAPPPYSSGNYGHQPNIYGNAPVGYSNQHYGYGAPPHGNPGFGNPLGGYGGFGSGGFNNNYGKYGNGLSRGSSALTGLGIAGASVGTVLAGLALWNLARSSGHSAPHNTYIRYDNRGVPVAAVNGAAPTVADDPYLKDLVNCTLTIKSFNASEVIAIPCSLASSFSPNAEVKDSSTIKAAGEETKCIVTVVTKTGTEYTTTIPCSTLVNTAQAANVTEPPPLLDPNANATGLPSQYPQDTSQGIPPQYPQYPPQYAQGVSPPYQQLYPQLPSGTPPQYPQGFSPQYSQGLSPQYPQGFSPQYSQGLSPQYQQGFSSQYPQGFPSQYPQGFAPQYPQQPIGANNQNLGVSDVKLSPISDSTAPIYSSPVNSGVPLSPLYEETTSLKPLVNCRQGEFDPNLCLSFSTDLTVMPLNNLGLPSTPGVA